jgi:hypothetical protein
MECLLHSHIRNRTASNAKDSELRAALVAVKSERKIQEVGQQFHNSQGYSKETVETECDCWSENGKKNSNMSCVTACCNFHMFC